MMVWRPVSTSAFFLRADAPHRMNTTRSGLAATAPDHLVGEGLPALALVRRGRVGAHGEGGVEQQHALVRPGVEAAVVGGVDAEIGLELLEDVLERRRQRRTPGGTEKHSPWAWPGPWYGSWPRITTFTSA